jgi:hypothetical protein
MAKKPTAELMARFHPKSEIRGDISGHKAPLSSKAFIETFGYEPKFLFNRDEI